MGHLREVDGLYVSVESGAVFGEGCLCPDCGVIALLGQVDADIDRASAPEEGECDEGFTLAGVSLFVVAYRAVDCDAAYAIESAAVGRGYLVGGWMLMNLSILA